MSSVCHKCNNRYYDKETHRKDCVVIKANKSISTDEELSKLQCPWFFAEFQSVYGKNNHKRACTKKPSGESSERIRTSTEQTQIGNDANEYNTQNELNFDRRIDDEEDNDNISTSDRRNPRRSCRLRNCDQMDPPLPETLKEDDHHGTVENNSSATNENLMPSNSHYLLEKQSNIMDGLKKSLMMLTY